MTRGQRLWSERDFRELFRHGRRAESHYVRSVWLPSAAPHLSVACITPKAIDKRATQRNLVRRRAREWVRKHVEYAALPARVALIFKVGALHATKQEFYAALQETFDRLARGARFN